MRNVHKILAANREDIPWETGIDGRVVLRIVLSEYRVSVETEFNRPRCGPMKVCYEEIIYSFVKGG
jgi:hypothetical protein